MILHLKPLIQPGIRDAFTDKLATLSAAAKFAHELRNNHIGHRSRDVANQGLLFADLFHRRRTACTPNPVPDVSPRVSGI